MLDSDSSFISNLLCLQDFEDIEVVVDEYEYKEDASDDNDEAYLSGEDSDGDENSADDEVTERCIPGGTNTVTTADPEVALQIIYIIIDVHLFLRVLLNCFLFSTDRIRLIWRGLICAVMLRKDYSFSSKSFGILSRECPSSCC